MIKRWRGEEQESRKGKMGLQTKTEQRLNLDSGLCISSQQSRHAPIATQPASRNPFSNNAIVPDRAES
jgi:hypothetical protein